MDLNFNLIVVTKFTKIGKYYKNTKFSSSEILLICWRNYLIIFLK